MSGLLGPARWVARTCWAKREGGEVLRMVVQTSAAAAKSYYQAAYYAEGGEEVGRWGGQAASQLGLEGEMAWSDFAALCDNRDPTYDAPLTPRTKMSRRIGYDLSFHVPKS